jgi:hypothetical protein
MFGFAAGVAGAAPHAAPRPSKAKTKRRWRAFIKGWLGDKGELRGFNPSNLRKMRRI